MKFYRDLKNCVIFFRTIFRTTILLNSVKLQYVLNAQSLQQQLEPRESWPLLANWNCHLRIEITKNIATLTF